MELKDLIREKRNNAGLTLEELALKTGIGIATLHRYETGEINDIKLNKLETIASALNLSLGELLNWNTNASHKIDVVAVPVYADVSCGLGTYIDDRIVDYDVVDRNYFHDGDFYITARGNSMNKLGIITGTRVYIKKQNYAEDNDIALVCLCSEETAVLKRFKTLTDGFMLMSESTENYSPMVFRSKDELETVAILGIAKSFKVNL